MSGTSNSTDSEAVATTDAQRNATKIYLSNIFLSYGVKDADNLSEYILIAMTGLSFAARQGVNREILILTAEHFAATEIVSRHNYSLKRQGKAVKKHA